MTVTNKKSLGLTEVIVSAVILSAVMAGFFAAFTVARSYINVSNKRMIAANYIRSELDSLYDDVRADTWGTGNLKEGTGMSLPLPISTSASSKYSGNYSVVDCSTAGPGTAGPGHCSTTGDYRQVTVNIDY